ncbi:flavin reductase family protein [Kitasatospora sp. NPDC096147]|uniref:flavin reductase family protein n=1 Tax=Kitasatospora sp. NPDC096147 TaxID=3364093 RepID=UPI003807C625
MAIDDEHFRTFFGAHPAGVCLVTAAGPGGEPAGLTTSAVIPASMVPPLLVIGVGNSSRTLEAIRHSGGFAVNFLAARTEWLSQRFAGKGDDKFAGLEWTPSEHAAGAPVLEAPLLSAVAECTVYQEVPAGDHRVFLGLIESATLFGNEPILYHNRAYVHLPVPALSGTATAD